METSEAPPPAFPAGWIRASAPSPDPRPRPKRLLDLEPHRHAVAPVAFRPFDLPLVEVLPDLDSRHAPTAPPSGEEPRELLVMKSRERYLDAYGGGYGAHVSVRNRDFGYLALGWESQWIGPRANGGVAITCGVRGGNGWRTGAWHTLSPLPDGSLRYEEVQFWFDHQTCRAWVMQRIEARAAPIAAGLVFGFRTSCPRCDPDHRERLHVIYPANGTDSGFNHSSLRIHEGSGGSMSATLREEGLEHWKKSGARPERERPTAIDVQVVRAQGEPEPLGIVSVGDADLER